MQEEEEEEEKEEEEEMYADSIQQFKWRNSDLQSSSITFLHTSKMISFSPVISNLVGPRSKDRNLQPYHKHVSLKDFSWKSLLKSAARNPRRFHTQVSIFFVFQSSSSMLIFISDYNLPSFCQCSTDWYMFRLATDEVSHFVFFFFRETFF